MITLTPDAAQTFDFALEGDEIVYSIPLPKFLPLKKLRKFAAIAAMPDGEAKNVAAIDAQLELLGAYMGDKADELTGEQVRLIFEAWNAAGGEELGE